MNSAPNGSDRGSRKFRVFDDSIRSTDNLSGSISGSSTSLPHVNYGGPASQYLQRRGFGWMLEVEEDETDTGKPLLEELDIDLKDIYYKIRSVILPIPHFGLNKAVIRDKPDFWGPLLVVILYAVISLFGQFKVVSWIITIWLIGSCFVYIIARSLGGEVYYAQCLGVIGYCLLPMLIVCLISILLTYLHPAVATAFRLLGVVWAAYSACSLLCLEELQKKRILLMYPIALLYVYFFHCIQGLKQPI